MLLNEQVHRCRVSPLSSVFFRKNQQAEVWRRTPSRNDAGSPRFWTPTNLFYLLYPGWLMSTIDSYVRSFSSFFFFPFEKILQKEERNRRRKCRMICQSNQSTLCITFKNSIFWYLTYCEKINNLLLIVWLLEIIFYIKLCLLLNK